MSGFQDVFGSEDQGYVLPAFGAMPSYREGLRWMPEPVRKLILCRGVSVFWPAWQRVDLLLRHVK